MGSINNKAETSIQELREYGSKHRRPTTEINGIVQIADTLIADYKHWRLTHLTTPPENIKLEFLEDVDRRRVESIKQQSKPPILIRIIRGVGRFFRN